MANYTEHYQLHQWEPQDNFLRTDFNEDFKKIDTALKGKMGCIFGSYTGNSDDLASSCTQQVELGFSPSLVLVWATHIAYTTNYDYFYQALATAATGFPNILEITDRGFMAGQLYGSNKIYNPNLNCGGKTYLYAAWY